ncbi:MAG: hypothetical protein JRJ42_07775 [Deltaproteobacteria bacterium]|nr:hypothetical protein [Deltaproteobacteria bacterium]MBW2020423.1 hypothetical protein [Deltaproteobacteria bacterium]MBW2075167.1 hypothetical protein [Deltaproteobacteria bacterium]
MASNFKILVQRHSDNLHLKLAGDFDGTSACELLNALKENCDDASKIFIHTSCLKDIYPFGLDTFHRMLYMLKNRPTHLIFTGEKAVKIAPERNNLFNILIMP